MTHKINIELKSSNHIVPFVVSWRWGQGYETGVGSTAFNSLAWLENVQMSSVHDYVRMCVYVYKHTHIYVCVHTHTFVYLCVICIPDVYIPLHCENLKSRQAFGAVVSAAPNGSAWVQVLALLLTGFLLMHILGSLWVWLKCLGPSHPCGRPGWSSCRLALA